MNLTNRLFTLSIILCLFLVGCGQKPCPLPEQVTYTKEIAPLIEAQCFLCHAPEVYKTKASRNKIFDYSSLKAMGESGQLVGSITHATGFIAMPYRKGVKIDSCSIELIKKWVTTGMKE